VQLAARICAQAQPGQILASNVVRELAAGKGFHFTGQRDVALKGFEYPVPLCEVTWRQGEASGLPLASRHLSVSLTPRETEVLSLLASGRSGKEIAAELSVSLSTVQRHIANIYAKIGVRGRVEAAAYAIERRLVRPRND
jgi:DNA-binding NarL/FixJ family response regulator